MLRTFHASSLAEWTKWLEEHYSSKKEVWLIFYKKHTGKPNISYTDAIEQALCFGWIDSIIQKIDDHTFARKFTPRKKTSLWSALNKRRATRLLKEGRMTEAGKATLTFSGINDDYGRNSRQQLSQTTIPAFLRRAIQKNQNAWIFFKQLAPSYRRNYIGWISASKTDETRQKRIREAITLLSRGKKLGLK
jgi:uncharacterized protein YdeI (YjbR/CyaY-like superfamily)